MLLALPDLTPALAAGTLQGPGLGDDREFTICVGEDSVVARVEQADQATATNASTGRPERLFLPIRPIRDRGRRSRTGVSVLNQG